MAMSASKYRKRVATALNGLSSCKYTVCKRCPFHSQGCKEKLQEEAYSLLLDYYHLLQDQAETAARKAADGAAAPAAMPLV